MSATEARASRGLSVLDVWGLGYVLAGIGLATAAAWPLYASPRAVAVGLVGGLLGMTVALVSRYLRWGVLLSATTAAAVYLIVAVPLAIPSGLTSVPAALAGVRDAVFGVVVGWKQILTLKPPLGEYQAVLVPFLLVMFFGAFAATLLVTHRGRRAVLAPVVLSAMSVFGIAFGLIGTSAPVSILGFRLPAPREWLLGVAVFVAALVWSVGRSRLRRARALRAVAAHNVSRRATPAWTNLRRHLLSAALLIVALVAGLAAAPAANTWAQRSVLRDQVEPMVVVQEQLSPLGAYRAWFTAERLDETVISLTGDTNAIDRIRFVALDAYDGEQFHISPDNRFSRLPRSAGSGQDRVSLEVTVGDAYRGIWVPAPHGLVEAPAFAGARADALLDGFHIDSDGDTAITIAQDAEGAVGLRPGDRYTLLSDAEAAPTPLNDAQGGESLVSAEEYPALADWVEMQELPRTGAGYVEAVDRLRARGYLSHSLIEDASATGWISALQAAGGYSFASSYAGHSAARIEELFTSLADQQLRAGSGATPAELVAAVGDDEQFAVAAAILARFWGLESRVVLGVRLPGAEEVAGIPPCTQTCTGENLTAWVEVRQAGADWSVVDVTPQFAMRPRAVTEGEQLPEYPTVPEQPRSEPVAPPEAQSDFRDTDAPPEEGLSEVFASFLAVLRVVGLSLLALGLLVLPAIAIVVAKQQRRAARRTATQPEVRIVGAWEEVRDLYLDHGRPIPVNATRAQVARLADRGEVAKLAQVVDRAVFAAQGPTDADAESAWAIVDRERAELWAQRTRWQRLRAALGLRAFVSRTVRRRMAPRSDRRGDIDTLAGADSRRQKEDV